MRIPYTFEEIYMIRSKKTKKVLKALDEVLTIEKLLKDGNFKNTKEILYAELEKALKFGME